MRILYVEDDPLILHAVKELLEVEGWRVEACRDGQVVMAKITGDETYDLLLLDYELPGASGIKIVLRARSLEHRRSTPNVIFSGSDVGMAARGAGANAFLRKPDDMPAIVKTVSRLLTASSV